METLKVAPGRLLIEPVELEASTGLIMKPDTAQKDPPTIGRILQVAEDLEWMRVKGDGTMYCIFRPHAGVLAEVDGKTYRILTPESIDGLFSWAHLNGGPPGASA